MIHNIVKKMVTKVVIWSIVWSLLNSLMEAYVTYMVLTVTDGFLLLPVLHIRYVLVLGM